MNRQDLDWQGKNVLIIGMAKSGIAAAQVLASLGAHVIANDMASAEQIHPQPIHGVCWKLGCPADEWVAQADCLIISPGVPVGISAIQRARELKIPVMGEMEFAYRLGKGLLLAITGTNGKTTTTSLVGEIIHRAGYNGYVVGNIGHPYSQIALNTHSEDYIIAEVSSFQLETVSSFAPHVAALLNLSADHLNRHGTMENYLATKLRIFENQHSDDYAVINADEPAFCGIAQKIPAKTIFFSRKNPVDNGAFVRRGQIIFCLDGLERIICPVSEVCLPGLHNLENVLAAVAMTCLVGIAPEVIAAVLADFTGVEHRLEYVDTIKDVRFINDSKGTNPDSTQKAVEAMQDPTVLILGGYDKGASFADLIGKLPGHIIRLILMGQTASGLEQECKRLGVCHYDRAAGFEDAVRKAFLAAQPGGNVLLSPACASFDMFRDYEQRGQVFKELVARLKEENL